jgi:hypothetical protein
MAAYGITDSQLQKVYHPVGPAAQLMVTTLPGTGKAGKQVTLALLLSVKQALGTGSFGCPLEELRQMCLYYAVYDPPNFAKNLRNNKTLFKPRQKGEDMELSGPGMKRAGALIKELSTAAE